MKNNKGITLIELIVTLALASIILTFVMSFFITNVKSYETINYETDVQYQSQSTINFMTNKILEAKDFVGLVGEIYKFEHNNGKYFGFKKDHEVIIYYEDVSDLSKSVDIGKYIKNLEIITNSDSEVKIILELYNDKKNPADIYSANQTVYMRNSKN